MVGPSSNYVDNDDDDDEEEEEDDNDDDDDDDEDDDDDADADDADDVMMYDVILTFLWYNLLTCRWVPANQLYWWSEDYM